MSEFGLILASLTDFENIVFTFDAFEIQHKIAQLTFGTSSIETICASIFFFAGNSAVPRVRANELTALIVTEIGID